MTAQGSRPGGRRSPGLFASLSVAIGCLGSVFRFAGQHGQGRATTAASPSPVFVSRTAPDAPVGRQLSWFLGAVGQIPWRRRVIEAHFDSGFLRHGQPGAGQLGRERAPGSLGASRPLGGFDRGAVAGPGPRSGRARGGGLLRRRKLAVSIAVDSAGRISGLQLRAIRPVSSWAQVDQDLAALAPDTASWPPGCHRRALYPGAPGGCHGGPAAGLDVQAVRPRRARPPDRRGPGLLEPATDGHRPAEEPGQPRALQNVVPGPGCRCGRPQPR